MFGMSRSCRALSLLLLIKCLCQKTATLKGREEHKSDLRLNDTKLSHYQSDESGRITYLMSE